MINFLTSPTNSLFPVLEFFFIPLCGLTRLRPVFVGTDAFDRESAFQLQRVTESENSS